VVTHHDLESDHLGGLALIRRLAADGVPKARIAERLGISRTTVLKAVRSESPPRPKKVVRSRILSGAQRQDPTGTEVVLNRNTRGAQKREYLRG